MDTGCLHVAIARCIRNRAIIFINICIYIYIYIYFHVNLSVWLLGSIFGECRVMWWLTVCKPQRYSPYSYYIVIG